MLKNKYGFVLALALLSAQSTQAVLFDALEYRNVGPTRGGRVTAVAGTVQQAGTFYLGASGGGVWKTTDYGTRWINVSDGYFGSPSIGDIAVSQTDSNVVYAGTGSDGLRSNVIRGDGVYKSVDAGASWEHVGLTETGHIGAVEIDPRNSDVVWVAAIGQAFNANAQRGAYKTVDGGKTWQQMLYISDETGIADIELLPGNPDVVFAAAWKARRKPWTIISGGTQEEGGLFKSEDGGDNWRRITAGLPMGLIGKIDLAISAADSRIVYALVEAPGPAGGLYRSTDQGETFAQVSSKKELTNRPFYYGNLEADPSDANVLHAMATKYFKSVDGGENWMKMDPPHGDSHDIWINPENPLLFVQANDGGANVTHNGGETWSTQFNQPTTELYTVDVDDQYPYWLYAGQQDNSTTIAVPSRAPSKVQTVEAWLLNSGGCETGPAVPKPGDHDTVYANCKGKFGVFNKRTGTERRYYVGAEKMYGSNPGDLMYRFQRVAPIHVSPHDPNVVYHGSQYLHRTRDGGLTWDTISPDLTAFEPDKQVVSGSPITRDATGEEIYSALYSIRESTIAPGVIWTGSNDGPVHVSRDGGESWQNVTPQDLPKGGRVDSVEPSHHDPAVAYIAVLRYQLGDWAPYAYRTDNYGERWTLLTDGDNGIPRDSPVRVVREDPLRPGLLYAGTEHGVFVSFDNGTSWQAFQQNLPRVPVTDIRIHRGDLVLSTMGRGFWVLDDVATLRQAALPDLESDVVLFAPAETVRYRQTYSNSDKNAVPQYPKPSAIIDYFLRDGFEGEITLEIYDANGERVNAFVSGSEQPISTPDDLVEDMDLNEDPFIRQVSLTTAPGMNRFHWNMRYRGAWREEADKRFNKGGLVPPGEYRLSLSAGDAVFTKPLKIVIDPRVAAIGVTVDDIQEQATLYNSVVGLLDRARRGAYQFEQILGSLTPGDSEYRETLTTAIGALVTEEGAYMEPGLIDQIEYLRSMLDNADQAPGNDAFDRYEALRTQLAAVLGT